MNSSTGVAPQLMAKEEFIAELGRSLEERRGYAAGKLGGTERAILLSPAVLDRESNPRRARAVELALAHKALRHGGIFPPRSEFLRRFGEVYEKALRNLDSVGLVSPADAGLLRLHLVAGRPIRYVDQEPDRSRPSDDTRCYLPLFRGRRLLLVSPFAELLRGRATPEIFEAVWRNTGKPWFEPASVDAVEFPYGFARLTHEQYGTALELLAEIRSRIEAKTFDVALIGAGTLGSMVASAVKEQGKLAISLGGHLQVLFGVIGARWRARPDWRREYFNTAWIDMPDRYKPHPADTDENYW